MKAIVITLTVLSALLLTGAVIKHQKELKESDPIPTPLYDAWVHWKQRNGKAYGTSTEDSYRLSVFYENFKYINTDYNPSNTYTLGLNKFADLTRDEFVQVFTGINKIPKGLLGATRKNYTVLPKATEDTVDWRTKGAVTPIKDQGRCGSCWAFSTTGSTEGAYQIKHTTLKSFSEQQLVDCAASYGNKGCNGGLMDFGFEYIKDKGLALEDDYPYTAKTGHCDKTVTNSDLKMTGYSDVPADDEEQFQAAVQKGPVSIAVDAGPLQLYISGIFNKTCGTQLDHGVLCVGYSVGQYYIVKNSWGEAWGEQGYVRMGLETESTHGKCGMFKQPSYPKVE